MYRVFLSLVVYLAFFAYPLRSEEPKPIVYVILWFDTEDYILPASDDAALKLADLLKKENIKATFKVVGEKARTLEKRGRTDVIETLKNHEIGYHSNFHSVPPSPALYLANLGWDEGVAEFDRRERPGFDDVKRIFGRTPTCYGQPGSSWAPQSYGAMRQWGIPIYLDSGRHLGLDGKPYYYCGAFTLYQLTHTLRCELGGEADLKKAEDRFLDARQKLLAEGGGVISTYYHPCEFVHKKFWDGVNFAKGANPPREAWQLPEVKTEAETRTAFETLQSYIQFLKRFPDVKFITASEARELYRDRSAGRKFSSAEIEKIAARVGTDVTFQAWDDLSLSPSEIFYLLNAYFVERDAARQSQGIVLPPTPFGPADASSIMTEAIETDASQFTRTASDVADYLNKRCRIPSAVWLGSVAVSPEVYLAALAKTITELKEGKPLPAKIVLKPAKLLAAKYVAEDEPRLWPWVIFPPNFHAPALMELAKRQAWTLKPALLHAEKK